MAKAKKRTYYSLDRILSRKATYNMIIGERSNGKTYACLKLGLTRYVEAGEQMALIRRWDTDYKGKNGQSMFDSLERNGVIQELTGGEWTGVYYWSGRWYLCRYDENGKRERDDVPFCYAFAVSTGEHDKSTSYPGIKTVVFDEFLTRTQYLPNEFVLYMNLLSTIIRDRADVKIFMLGNTVNKFCPYFGEMGLTHIWKMKQGDIDVYRYGESKLTVAVEYCKANKEGKPSDVYFAFDNPKLAMITGGEWEIDIYPHSPYKYRPKDVLFTYWIQFDRHLLQCEVIQYEDAYYTYIHRKTGDIKHPERDLVFSPEWSPLPNWRRNLLRPTDDIGKKIMLHYKQDKIFYQDNEIGEIVRNYMIWCGKEAR